MISCKKEWLWREVLVNVQLGVMCLDSEDFFEISSINTEFKFFNLWLSQAFSSVVKERKAVAVINDSDLLRNTTLLLE